MAQSGGQPPLEPASSLLPSPVPPPEPASETALEAATKAAQGFPSISLAAGLGAAPSPVTAASSQSLPSAADSASTATSIPTSTPPSTPPPTSREKHPGLFRRLLGRVNGNGIAGAPGQQDDVEPEPRPEPEHGPGSEPELKTESRRDVLPDLRAGVMTGDEAETGADGGVPTEKDEEELDPDDPRLAPVRRGPRAVVPNLPRAFTIKRQHSELRDHLIPAELSPAERRAFSNDRRLHSLAQTQNVSECQSNPRSSAPDLSVTSEEAVPLSLPSTPASPLAEKTLDMGLGRPVAVPISLPADDIDGAYPFVQSADSLPPQTLDTLSMTTTQFERVIHDDLEKKWILNLSMLFRDKSKREKFFVTYRQEEHLWRRVTISLDYRAAPDNSLEMDLDNTRYQRDKNAKIYEAIRESLQDIQFYPTVTNLKLQTTEGRLHVHVVEDVNEIIPYPKLRSIRHLRCRRVKESEIEFDSHMSGFVYKVRVHGITLIKKEIPGPDTVDEFLYEVNALTQLQDSRNVIELYGVVVDDQEEHVKGLLISFAEKGALVDIIFDHDHRLPWPRREKWARQIVEGLSEIHESGFVQGDFTLSNIVVDQDDNAKIIDINRRGCPVGWEPPEATPLIEGGQRIHMYIGVKSDLYQLGMVLWALATQEDEPEANGRPLRIEPAADCPPWFRTIVDTCLAEDPRLRAQAVYLRGMFPAPAGAPHARHTPSISVASSSHGGGGPIIRTVGSPPPDWSFPSFGGPGPGPRHPYVEGPPQTNSMSHDPYYFPHLRGRSPPSPIHSSAGPDTYRRYPAWSAYSYEQSARSERSVSVDESRDDGGGLLEVDIPDERSVTPRTNTEPAVSQHRPALRSMFSEMTATNQETPRAEIKKFIPGEDTPPEATMMVSHGDQGGEQSSGPVVRGVDVRPESIPLPRSPFVEAGAEEEAEQGTGGATEAAKATAPPSTTARNEANDEPQREPGITAPGPESDTTEAKSQPLLPPSPNHLTATMTMDQLSAGGADSHRAESGSNHEHDSSKTGPAAYAYEAMSPSLLTTAAALQAQITQAQAQAQAQAQDGAQQSNPATRLPSSSRSPSTRGSPVAADLPDELKGIGAAYDLTDEEAMRTQGSVIDDDDLGILSDSASPSASASALACAPDAGDAAVAASTPPPFEDKSGVTATTTLLLPPEPAPPVEQEQAVTTTTTTSPQPILNAAMTDG